METKKKQPAIEEAVAALLKKKNLKITCAESCTGGLISGRLVNVPGISSYYETGIVTYSNRAKEKLLQVSPVLLETYGAVSSQVAEAMARGAAAFAEADVSIAVTGIAGPDGGTAEKPVGLVYIACFFCDRVTVERHIFSGNRQQVREKTVQTALELVYSILMTPSEELP